MALLAAALPALLGAQQRRGAQLEGRLDLIDAVHPALHAAGGASWIAGTYVRVALIAGGGVRWRDDAAQGSGRAELVARFTLDPLQQSRWALYAAGGVGALYDPTDEWRGVLIVAIGLEGPPSRGLMPALEVGAGGGLRTALVIRRARRERR